MYCFSLSAVFKPSWKKLWNRKKTIINRTRRSVVCFSATRPFWRSASGFSLTDSSAGSGASWHRNGVCPSPQQICRGVQRILWSITDLSAAHTSMKLQPLIATNDLPLSPPPPPAPRSPLSRHKHLHVSGIPLYPCIRDWSADVADGLSTPWKCFYLFFDTFRRLTLSFLFLKKT